MPKGKCPINHGVVDNGIGCNIHAKHVYVILDMNPYALMCTIDIVNTQLYAECSLNMYLCTHYMRLFGKLHLLITLVNQADVFHRISLQCEALID